MKKHIPNTLTCCNLICGAIATFYAFAGNYELAMTFIITGAVFDFFDGFAARLLHVQSPIGKELDSLADDITFGLAPAAIVFSLLHRAVVPETLHAFGPALPFIAFLIAAFSALRLAKFNLDERQTTSFIGLPTPANALFWGALACGFHEELTTWPYTFFVLVALILLTCYMLIAEIPLFALKFKSFAWKGNEVRYLFMASSLLMLVLWGVAAFAGVILWYVVLSVVTQKKLS